jgi:hypothetical protein
LKGLDVKKIGSAEFRLLDIAPRVDPGFALDLADRAKFPDPWYGDYLRYAVADGLADESPDEALPVAETVHGNWLRAQVYLKVADAPP